MDNKKMAIGTYGYIDELKKKSKSNMIVYFVFAVGLLAASFLIMKTVLSAFTVAAIAMLIPVFQGFKQHIYISGFSSCPEHEYQKISDLVTGKLYIVLLSDLVLTGSSGDMMLNMAVIYNNNIYGYAPVQKTSVDQIEALLAQILEEAQISTKKPVVHTDFQEFEDMIMLLSANEPSVQQDVGRIYHQIESYCL